MSVQIQTLNTHSDLRGCVFEPLLAGELAAQRNAHVVLTEPGHIRGNHYHPRGTEILAVVGPALIRYKENGQVHDIEVPDKQAIRLTIPPGIAHAIKNTGTTTNLLIGFNTVEHNPAEPDVVRDVLIDG
jgi:UDP-2-acetamido-2,6-beta-L-arabino-hexul-4-ose reductase